ncbi:RagB/SusD family nutrient uptake outer membrane protein [Flavivirga abyssicola]|uniref:RagB/SusD family nutrient uptake outer membrane protein n=1 Tax=Flavivirga abyssicola TaxID=3063533 RepID=UPI0026E044A2|nr:RagB/SusD family nutrient uptake outer membrane protein [Flavivirga sp. MEBiC07777]WVK13163.1 RagB/SusD family nutrient uptake outer membrane protein [Flavivirga sp. MEBiC07777]
MKFRNIKGIVTIGALLLVLLYGCSDSFLQDPNTKDLTEAFVYGSDATAIAAVTGVYDGLQNDSQGDPGLPNEYNVKGIFAYANYPALDWQPQARRADSDYFNFDVNPDGEVPVKIWPNNYRAIGRANNALVGLQSGIDGGSISADLGNRLIGEVLVIRAISYQYLAAVYGDVPIMLSIADDPFKGRDPQDMVFQQIVTDMNDAVNRLPWSHDTDKGRVTKGTAYAVLGNAHMWLKQYSEAITAFEAIEAGGVTSLEPDYFDIHALDNPNGVESLFELQWAANGDLGWNRNDEVNILQLFAMPTDITGGGGFAGIPTKELYDSFEPGDLRRQATVIAPGEEHPDPLIDINMYDGVNINTAGTVAEPWTGGDPAGRSGYWGVKSWRDPNIDGWGREQLFGGQGHIWIRYGEVLLSLAESALREGQTAKAQTAFDRVRDRAWGGTAPAKTVSIANILQEYRHELGGEFSLWAVIRRSGEAAMFIQDSYGLTLPQGRDLMPVPNTEISVNSNLLPQNTGY